MKPALDDSREASVLRKREILKPLARALGDGISLPAMIAAVRGIKTLELHRLKLADQ